MHPIRTTTTLAALVLGIGLTALEARGVNLLVNGSFESPPVAPASNNFPATIPGWQTNDTSFEVWGTGFNGVPSFDGNQFIELNAFIAGTVTQSVAGIGLGAQVGFELAHRGRAGVDTMNITLTDLGANNVPGGGDDTVLFTKNYSDGITAWGFYDQTTEPPILALGNPIQYAATAVVFASGNPAVGNFLDAASLSVVPEPTSSVLLGAGGLMLLRRRRKG